METQTWEAQEGLVAQKRARRCRELASDGPYISPPFHRVTLLEMAVMRVEKAWGSGMGVVRQVRSGRRSKISPGGFG